MKTPYLNRKNKIKYTLLVIMTCFSIVSCEKSNISNGPKDQGSDSSGVIIPVVDSIKPSIQIDPEFAYYKNRSVESIVDEITINGYQIVHYFVTNENSVNGALINALHKAGVEVWLLTLGNGTYSTSDYPAGWEKWKMTLNKSINGSSGFIFLSPFNKEFVAWKKNKLVELVTQYPFDGIELAEAFLPAWNGLSNEGYGDVGPNAIKGFKEEYGVDIPNFKNPSANNYYKKAPDLYKDWVDFRVNAVNQFLNEIYNGVGGVREKRPDIKVATWSLGISGGRKSIDLLREYQGLDAAAMVKLVKPDLHYIQTHWPDWMKNEQDLSPSYTQSYIEFLRDIKKVDKDLPVGIQADIGSIKSMIKSKKWFDNFAQYAKEVGFSTFTAYEYHLGGYMYNESLKVMKAQRVENNSILLSFNKRIQILKEDNIENFIFFNNNIKLTDVVVEESSVDGNRIKLKLSKLPENSFEVGISGVSDTPNLWLFKDFNANVIQGNSRIKVNENK